MAVQTVEEAVKLAENFLKRYYPLFYRLEKVTKEEDTWLTEFDVGILETKIIRVRVDAATGKIVEYTKV